MGKRKKKDGGEKKCQVKQDKVERKEEKKRKKSQKGNDDFAKRKRERGRTTRDGPDGAWEC